MGSIMTKARKIARVVNMWMNREPQALLGGRQKLQLLWKIIRKFSRMLNMELPDSPATSLLGVDPKESKTHVHTRPSCTDVADSIVRNGRVWKRPRGPRPTAGERDAAHPSLWIRFVLLPKQVTANSVA